MADITYQPGQVVPAGNYIVILRPVEGDINNNNNSNTNNNNNGEIAPPAEPAPNNYQPAVPPEGMPAEVPSETTGETPVTFGTANPGNNIGMQGGRKRMGKKTKKAKKAKGTRKLSPYMKFAQVARPKILKENPNLKSDIIGVGRKIGEMWRALPESEKAKY